MLLRRQQYKLGFGPELKTWANFLQIFCMKLFSLQPRHCPRRKILVLGVAQGRERCNPYSICFQRPPLHSNNSNTRILINRNKNDTTLREILIIPKKITRNNTEQLQITQSRKISLGISINHSKYQAKYIKSRNSTHVILTISKQVTRNQTTKQITQSRGVSLEILEAISINLDQSQQKIIERTQHYTNILTI